MHFVDSHCHLNYLDHPQQALAQAAACGVAEMLCIGVEQRSISQVLGFAQTHDHVWASVGEHPSSATSDASWVESYIGHPKVVALGEMGFDYHYETEPDRRGDQHTSFYQQLSLADHYNLPVIIHTRAAQQETLDALASHPDVIGVLHCFTESWEMAKAALDMGYYVSISGIVTFNKADNVREVARKIPEDRLLIETDSPWLAPVPHRGKQNQPAYVVNTARYLAELRSVSIERLAQQTTENFHRLFSRTQMPLHEIEDQIESVD